MKIGILTYGCSVNRSDSELMATLLARAGFEPELESEKPKLLIVNTCIVKGPTENKILRKLKDLQEAGKKVIITGCMPEAYPHLAARFPDFAVLGIDSFDIVAVVRDYLGQTVVSRKEAMDGKVLPKTIKYNQFIEIVPISEGCLGSCTYCATKFARGSLVSYNPEALLDGIRQAVGEGVKEVWLTSQDNGCYGFDIGTNLAELLRAVVEIPGDFKVRVGMMNPQHIGGFLDELIDAYKSDKVFKFLHIPIQSGSDKVLEEMGRGYTAEDFLRIVSKFREAMELTVSTDIIVGFPTETEKDFQKTIQLLKRAQPDFLNLSKYWPRKKTKAGEMKQLPREVVAARSREVAKLFSEMLKEKNKSWIGKTCSVTFTDKKGDYLVGRNSLYRPVLVKANSGGLRQQSAIFDRTFSKSSVGRNSLYRPVLVEGENLLGKIYSVKIIKTKKSELLGELYETSQIG